MRSIILESILLTLLSINPISALTFDCANIIVSDKKFDLSPLAPASHERIAVDWIRDQPPSVVNTSFVLGLCKNLDTKAVAAEYGLLDGETCAAGSRVCAIERDRNVVEGGKTTDNNTDWAVRRVMPIAGEFTTSHGRGLEPNLTRLKDENDETNKKEGVRVELNGGRYPDTTDGVLQKAIIEFICDRNKTGLERRNNDESGKEIQHAGEKSLKFISYKSEHEVDVLRLEWKTKYACEDISEDDRGEDEDHRVKVKTGYGFFGWFFIVLFVVVASYIIFNSWINYTRLGYRGIEVLPHSDFFHDLPYILKDWARSVIDTIQGKGHRGGYSAV